MARLFSRKVKEEQRKMVGTDEALESKYVTAELIRNSPTKKLVVMEEGSYEEVTYENETSKRLTIPVQVDAKERIWRPNRDSIANMRGAYGNDTKSWVGKATKLQVVKVQGKDSVIATGIQ